MKKNPPPKGFQIERFLFYLLSLSQLALVLFLVFSRRNVYQVSYSPNLVDFSSDTNFVFKTSRVYRSSTNVFVNGTSELTASPSTNGVPSSNSSIREFSHPYSVFLDRGEFCAQLFDFVVRSGDRVSYGVIDQIFPDRIFLSGGSVVIRNSSTTYRVPSVKAERTSYDRIAVDRSDPFVAP